MAYIGHSPIREARDFFGAARAIANPALVGRCALVAVAAAVAILALSDGFTTTQTGPQTAILAKKGDRIAAPQAAVGLTGGYFHDQAARTTTVERGAVVPLGAQSPMLAGSK